MKERIKNVFKDSYFFEWYYIVVVLCYVATLFSSAVRPGVVAAVLMCACLAELFIDKKMNIHILMDVLIVVYFFYKALTIICIIMGGVMPVGVYFQELAVSLLPMIFYFAGRAGDKNGGNNGFYRKLMYALFILGFVGLILYITAPQFYCDYLYNWVYISKADASTMRVRMQSVVGSTVLGSIMVMGMGAAASFIEVDPVKSKEPKVKRERIFGVVAICLTMFFGIMSNQRSAMVAAAILLVYILYCVFFKFSSIPKKNLYIGIAVAILLFAALCVIRFDFVLKIWWRIESLPGAIAQRQEQWIAAVNNMYSSWFGNGLGANGHRAIGIEGAHVIADGGLVKIYCEEGVIGFSLFVYILFLSFQRGIRNFKESFSDMGIIVVALLMSIGSNVLAFQLVNPVFWYAVGRIWKNAKKQIKD